jgi:hypothetical protein
MTLEPIQYIRCERLYCRNVHTLEVNDFNLTNQQLVEYIESKGYDHNTFGTEVHRFGNAVSIHFYTD